MTDVITATARFYDMGGGAPPCEEFGLTPSGFYAPLSTVSTYTPGVDFLTPADGVMYYLHPGASVPDVPMPGTPTRWNFPAGPPPATYTRFDATGLPDSTGDFAVSWGGNGVRLIFVGDGVATLRFGGSGFPTGVQLTHAQVFLGYVGAGGLVSSLVFDKLPIESAYTTGESVAVPVTGGAEGICTHIIDVTFGGGNYFGWGGAFWAAEHEPGEIGSGQPPMRLHGAVVDEY